MSGDNQDTSTVTNKVELPAFVQPHLGAIANDSGDLYNLGIGPEFYPEQTFTNFNPTQTYAFDQTLAQAGSDTLNPMAFDFNQGVLDRWGVSDHAWGAADPARDIASGVHQITTGDEYDSIFQNSAPGQNPYFDQMINNQLDELENRINSQYSGAGRYGSGMHGGRVAKELGKVSTGIRAAQYNADIQNQMNALLGKSNVEGTNIQNRANTSLELGKMWQGAQDDAIKAMALAPMTANAQYDPLRAMAGVGDAYAMQDQKALDENMARYAFMNEQPWRQLNLYASALQGIPMPASSTQTMTKPGPSLAQSLIGPAAVGAGIAGMVPGAGLPLILGGAALGGGLGLFGR
jgi:hypothetical protein